MKNERPEKITLIPKEGKTFGTIFVGELFINKDFERCMKTVWRKTSPTNGHSIVNPEEDGGGWQPDDEVIRVRVKEIIVEED